MGKNKDWRWIVGLLFLGVAFIFGIGAFCAWLVMLLWNGLIAGLLWPSGPEIGFWQAWGLMILMNLIFGGLSAFNRSSKS
jgi:hypothetical protein